MQAVTLLYLLCLFSLLLWIQGELPLFREAFSRQKLSPQTHLWKPPTTRWMPNFYGLLVGFYVQPFIFSLRGELLLPTLRRSKKVAKISVISEALLFSAVGGLCYLVFGDRFTPRLFILRAPYQGKSPIGEKLFQSLILCFMVLNTLGLGMYNCAIREYLSHFMEIQDSRAKFLLISLTPFACICALSVLFPDIIELFVLFGYTIYNFNGYIIPFLLAIRTAKHRESGWL